MSLADLGGWPAVLGPVLNGEDLPAALAHAAMTAILAGEATPAQIAAFAVGLRIKGETVEEMGALVDAMRSVGASVAVDGVVIDTCGTGGDRSGTVNVSTMAALVAAGAGARVCKHGNRAASSLAGSADVFEALGVVLELTPEGVARCIEEVGIGFCLATHFHPAMRHVGPTRRELGVPTVFNFLGPLANPARVRRQVVGVSDSRMAERMLGVLMAGGAEHAMVVYGHDGLDELSTVTPSTVLSLVDGVVTASTVDPGSLGFAPATHADLKGGDAANNAERVRAVLGGEPGPQRDIVVLNAAAALVVAGLAADIPEGLGVAATSIDSGAAMSALDCLIKVSGEAAG